MAILGLSGMLELVREYPDPQTFCRLALINALMLSRLGALPFGQGTVFFCSAKGACLRARRLLAWLSGLALAITI